MAKEKKSKIAILLRALMKSHLSKDDAIGMFPEAVRNKRQFGFATPTYGRKEETKFSKMLK